MTQPKDMRALLADGTVAPVRRLRPDDAQEVLRLHQELPNGQHRGRYVSELLLPLTRSTPTRTR